MNKIHDYTLQLKHKLLELEQLQIHYLAIIVLITFLYCACWYHELELLCLYLLLNFGKFRHHNYLEITPFGLEI